jgi:hypothetical protein
MQALLTFFAQYPLQTTVLTCLLLAAVLVFVVWFNQPARREQRRIRRAVSRLGAKSLGNVRLSDGVDGEIFIDYLVLTPNDIKIVSVKHYPGLIYGGEQLPNWTQVVNRRSHTFPNPLHEMSLKVMIVKAIVPDAEVNGITLFGRNSRFPTSQPEGVVTLHDINAQAATGPIPVALLDSWNTLSAADRLHRQRPAA